MSQIIGRRIDNTYTFTLDGQKKENNVQEPQPLKQIKIVPTKIKNSTNEKIQKKPVPLKQNKNVTNQAKPQKDKQPYKIPASKQRSQTQKQQTDSESYSDSEGEIETRITQPVSQIVEMVRQKRNFTPLSEQFPNILRQIGQQIPQLSKEFEKNEKKYAKIKDSSESSDSQSSNEFITRPIILDQQNIRNQQKKDSCSDENSGEEEQFSQPPQPEIPSDHINNTNLSSQQKPQSLSILINNNRESKTSNGERQNNIVVKEQTMTKHQIMNQYGKQQICRTHTFKEPMEHKQKWGYNQKRQSIQDQKLKKLKQEKVIEKQEKQQYMEQRRKERDHIKTLFPEGSVRQSRFKLIWDEEARSASRKKVEETKKSYVPRSNTEKKSKSLPPEKIEAINKMILLNAKRRPDNVLSEIQKKLDLLHKKAIVTCAEKKAKEQLKKFKKVPFVSPWDGFDLDDQALSKITTIGKSSESSQLNDISETFHPQNQVQGGRVISQIQYVKVQKNKEKKRARTEKLIKSLSVKDIKNKKSTKFTREEQMIKEEIKKDIEMEFKIEKEKQKLLRKQGIIQNQSNREESMDPIEIGIKIFEEANLPQLSIDYEPQPQPKRIDDRFLCNLDDETLEKEFKQFQKQKQSRAQKEQPIQLNQKKLIATAPVKHKQVNPAPKVIHKGVEPLKQLPNELRKNLKSKVEPSKQKRQDQEEYQVEQKHMDVSQIFERDIEEAAKHIDMGSVWKKSQYKAPFKNESDEDDEEEFLTSRVDRYIPNNKIKEVLLPHKAKEKYQKQVSFVEQKSDESGFLDTVMNKREKIATLINKQKLKNTTGQQFIEDDVDEPNNIVQFTQQFWSTNDPISRDIFSLSIKELMNLQELIL